MWLGVTNLTCRREGGCHVIRRRTYGRPEPGWQIRPRPSGAELKLILREVKCRVLVKVVTQIIVNINLGWQEKQERSRMWCLLSLMPVTLCPSDCLVIGQEDGTISIDSQTFNDNSSEISSKYDDILWYPGERRHWQIFLSLFQPVYLVSVFDSQDKFVWTSFYKADNDVTTIIRQAAGMSYILTYSEGGGVVVGKIRSFLRKWMEG